jgi:hypothetical protein
VTQRFRRQSPDALPSKQDLPTQRDALLSLGVEAKRVHLDHGLTDWRVPA